MDKIKLYRRTQVLITLIIFVTVIFLYFLFYKSSSLAGLSVQSDEMKENAIQNYYSSTMLEGKILDSEGVVLSEGKNPGEIGTLTFPKIYSWLFGYRGIAPGLKDRFQDYLYMPGKNNQGADVTLTINHDIQSKANSLIAGTDASLIVMEIKSGRILALASSREEDILDANNMTDEKKEKWKGINGFYLQNGYRDKQEPGSVFKVVTASTIIENGMENDIVDDQGTVHVGTHDISNVNRTARGKINLSQALGYSSNVYFATKGLELGKEKLEEKAEDFLIGQDFDLDFTSIRSNFDLSDGSEDLLADTSYGQGNTLITPLHIAMIYQSIANEGKMLRPYMVDHISLGRKSLYKGKKEVLTEPISEETAKKLDEMLQSVASDYYGIDDSSIRAKTGTAQIPNNTQKLYFASYNDKYVVVMSKISEEGYGRSLMASVLEMYQYLSTQ